MGGKLSLAKRIGLSNLRRLKSPYKITLECTTRCNLSCSHCNIWKDKNQGPELTPKEIEKVVRRSGINWLNLTGGEPFLRDDLTEIIKGVANSSDLFLINLTTNGSFPAETRELALKMLKEELTKIIFVVSIDGDRETHNKIRGSHSWEKAVESYKNLKRIADSSRLETFIGLTLSDQNLGQFDRTFRAISEEVEDLNKSDFHFNLYHPSKHYYRIETDKLDRRKAKDRLDQHSQEAGGSKAAKIIEGSYTELAKTVLGNNKTINSPISCQALSSSCFINSKGEIYPCIHFPKKLGEIKNYNYDLHSLWRETQKTRQQIEEKNCPGCWTPCEAYQSILGNLTDRKVIKSLLKSTRFWK